MKRDVVMNLIRNSMIAAVVIVGALNGSAYAGALSGGGVSDGGGGTTNPRPADPAWIADVVSRYAGRVLLTSLTAEEDNLNRTSPAEQVKSPFDKLFRSEKNVFDVVRSTSIELRMTEPCYDKKGKASDGSIYASQPGAICISPYTMAPKLNDLNYEMETAALIMHELSHLMGTTEEEAQRIQQSMIYGLSKVNLPDMISKLNHLSESLIPGLSNRIEMMVNGLFPNLPHPFHQSDVFDLSYEMRTLHHGLYPKMFFLHGLHESTFFEFRSQYLRLTVIRNGICASDDRENEEVRKSCVAWIEKAFAGNASATASEIELRTGTLASDEVTIRRPTQNEDLVVELKSLQTFLEKVRSELVYQNEFQFRVVLK